MACWKITDLNIFFFFLDSSLSGTSLGGHFQFLAKENSITRAVPRARWDLFFIVRVQFNYGKLLPCNNELWVFTCVFHLLYVGKEIKAYLSRELIRLAVILRSRPAHTAVKYLLTPLLTQKKKERKRERQQRMRSRYCIISCVSFQSFLLLGTSWRGLETVVRKACVCNCVRSRVCACLWRRRSFVSSLADIYYAAYL